MSNLIFLAPDLSDPVESSAPTVEKPLYSCSGERGRNLSMTTVLSPASPLLRSLVSQCDDVHVAPWVNVQTCGHTPVVTDHQERITVCAHETPSCRDVVALVRGTARPVGSIAELRDIARTAGVPLYEAEYDASDHLAHANIFLDGEWTASSLREMRMSLSEDQWRHEDSKHPDCSTREGKPDRRLISSWTEPYQRTLRKVPGSRHARVDGIMVCDSCGEPVGIVDTQPYSDSHRRNRASYLAPLGLVLGVDIVLVEHADRKPMSSSVNVVRYTRGNDHAASVERGSYYDAVGALYDLIDDHRCNVGGR